MLHQFMFILYFIRTKFKTNLLAVADWEPLPLCRPKFTMYIILNGKRNSVSSSLHSLGIQECFFFTYISIKKPTCISAFIYLAVQISIIIYAQFHYTSFVNGQYLRPCGMIVNTILHILYKVLSEVFRIIRFCTCFMRMCFNELYHSVWKMDPSRMFL